MSLVNAEIAVNVVFHDRPVGFNEKQWELLKVSTLLALANFVNGTTQAEKAPWATSYELAEVSKIRMHPATALKHCRALVAQGYMEMLPRMGTGHAIFFGPSQKGSAACLEAWGTDEDFEKRFGPHWRDR